MAIEWWGFGKGIFLKLPEHFAGYLALILLGGAFLSIVAFYREDIKFGDQGDFFRSRWVVIILLLAAPLLEQLLLVRIPFSANASTDLSYPVGAPVFAILGALPWMLLAGAFGVRPALFAGFLAGTARAGFATSSMITPFSMSLQAGFVAWMLRRDYGDLAGRLMRSPLFGGFLGGAIFGVVQVVERFVYQSGDLYFAIDKISALLWPSMLAAVLESSLAGAICEVVRRQWNTWWYNPADHSVAPYSRTLASRLTALFLIIGIIGSGMLLAAEWLATESSSRAVIESQIRQTASHASASIPYFVRIGRTFSRQLARDIEPLVLLEPLASIQLEDRLKTFSFFDHIEIFDQDQNQLLNFPTTSSAFPFRPQEYRSNLQSALRGVPSETIEASSGPSASMWMGFLTPIQPVDGDNPVGVIVGWTNLESNLILSPVLESFRQFPFGSAFIVDERGDILLRSGETQDMHQIGLPVAALGEVLVEPAPDGTRWLIYREAVEEYSWYIIVVSPLQEVWQRALTATLRSAVLLGVVGMTALVALSAISRRLTKPIRLMADMTQAITRGNFDGVIPQVGDDELGRFSSSFESMRQSLKKRLDEMSLLLAVSQQVAQSFELAEIIPPILEAAREMSKADMVRVKLTPPVPAQMHVVPGSFQAGDDPGNWSSLDAQVLELTQERGRFALENPARAGAVLDLASITIPIEALTAFPLQQEDEFLGVLWLGHRTPYGFSADEINLLSILCGQLVVAISNINSYLRADHERQRLVAVLDNTPDAVFVVDPQGRIVLLNPAALSLLEVTGEEAIGQPVGEVVSNPELVALMSQREQSVQAAEVEIGRGRIMFATVSDIATGERGTSGRVCVLWDVTHYKKLDSLKTEFVSTVSHDLRAPLTLMRGYATMLGMVGDMNEQQKEFLRKILNSVEQMSKLVDNLLDLSRIEAGLGLSLSTVHTESLLHEVIETYRPRAVNKQVALEVVLADDMEPVDADPALLRQAIANLLDNAIKYTPSKGIVTIQADQRDGYQLISVRDTGVGIAPTDRVRLFEKFYRVRDRAPLKEQGLGLGLAIVKSIIEQHGGRILVESKLGQGSTFTLILPMRADPFPDAQPMPAKTDTEAQSEQGGVELEA